MRTSLKGRDSGEIRALSERRLSRRQEEKEVPNAERQQQYSRAWRAAVARVRQLHANAGHEGLFVSLESVKDHITFFKTILFTQRPFVALLDNGNLRLVWVNQEKEQVAIQFRGKGGVQVVLFAKRGNGQIERLAERIQMSNMVGLFKEFGVYGLLAE